MNIAGFYEDSITNGEGLRSVLFISGCPHRCYNCHNQQAWNEDYGEIFNLEYYYQKIISNKLIKGITLSGGEPLTENHIKELIPLLEKIKENTNLDIWCYTGYFYEELIARNDYYTKYILELIDILVDGPFIDSLKDQLLLFRGSSNQRIINLNEGEMYEDKLFARNIR